MMPAIPTQCTVNDLRMRETLAKAERYHQLNRQLSHVDQPGQHRSTVVERLVRAFHRTISVRRLRHAG